VGAEFDRVGRELFAQRLVYRPDGRRVDKSITDIRLVRHDDDLVVGLSQRPRRPDCPRKQPEILEPTNGVAFPMNDWRSDKRPVTVKKDAGFMRSARALRYCRP
jgi:hypothetical protein